MDLEDLYRLLRTSHVQSQGIVDNIDTQFRELALPFVIASAYSNTDLPRDDSLRGIANVGKPTNIATLIQILHRITDF